ncbi:MAG: metallophosphatase family protein [Actinomycetota bacterium]|nr:metallophosphatase family protein [Actinomycetota bacterium]
MRVAILSDIHGNLPALEAVVQDIDGQSPDEIWCGGDIAWAGPWGADCVARVKEAGWPTVRGNTDVWVTGDPQTVESPEARRETETLASAHDLSAEDALWLLNLPLGHSGPGSLLLVHGTPESPFDAPMPDASPAEFQPYEGHAGVVVYGHVHRAFFRRLAGGTIVCNTGSVGLPMDGDTASYLLVDLTGPEVTLRHRRVAFDRAGAIQEARRIGGPVAERFLEGLGEQ